jgi:predicted outer membrane repeat protein
LSSSVWNSSEHITAVDLNNNIIRTRRLQDDDYCVMDEHEFRIAIATAPTLATNATRIDICVPSLSINASLLRPTNTSLLGNASLPNQTFQGINIKFKNLDIRCNQTVSSSRCILNAQNLSRHFYIERSNVVFRNFIFENGNGMKDTMKDGGSMFLNRSNVLLDRCQFKENMGGDGGAIYSLSTNITMIGGSDTDPTLFENNVGKFFYGGAIVSTIGQLYGGVSGSKSSSILATNGFFVFRNNTVGAVRCRVVYCSVSKNMLEDNLTLCSFYY